MRLSREEHWSGLPCPLPEDLTNPGMEPASLTSLLMAGGVLYHWHHLGSPTEMVEAGNRHLSNTTRGKADKRAQSLVATYWKAKERTVSKSVI